MLHQKLAELKEQMLSEALLVQEMFQKSVDGIFNNNPVPLNTVINEEEPKVDADDRLIDKLSVELIAQYEPVATDLRLAIMIVKINKDLERIADHTVNISESGLFLIANPCPCGDLRPLADHAGQMLKDSIKAFSDDNSSLARSVCGRDEVVDVLGGKLLQESAEILRGRKCNVNRQLHFMRIAHNLERITALATNIAEEVVYIVDGEDIKHLKIARKNGSKGEA